MGYTITQNRIRAINLQPPNNGGLDGIYRQYQHKFTDLVQDKGIWKGHPCFIIGGGESLDGFDYSKLRNHLTIGVNKAFIKFCPSLIYTVDMRFYKWVTAGVLNSIDGIDYNKRWQELDVPKVMLCPVSYEKIDSKVYIVRRIVHKLISKNLLSGIYGSNNSGIAAAMLAIALGANPIYLVGFDMQVKNRTHWHGGYPEQGIDDSRRKTKLYKQELDGMAGMIHEAGVEVINLVTYIGASALENFPIKLISEVL